MENSRRYDEIKERITFERDLLLAKKSTIRAVAKAVGRSKSAVYNDFMKMERYSVSGAELVKEILKINLSERHIRGGESTRKKYLKLREENLKKV